MFSKFLYGKDEDALAAIKMEFNMEFSKATRKILKKKRKENSKGRRLKIQPNLNGLSEGIDLTKLASLVATTRDGRRLHQKVSKDTEKKSDQVIVFFALYFFHLSCFLFFVCFMIFYSKIVAATKNGTRTAWATRNLYWH